MTSRGRSSSERRGRDSNPRDRGYRSNGFQDRRIQPLCHPSMVAASWAGACLAQGLHSRRISGEVAEWLKALAC